MVLTGGLERFLLPRRVTGLGQFLADGWQIVARYPASKLQSGTGRYAFVVAGMISQLAFSGQLSDAVAEVAIGSALGGSITSIAQHHRARVPFRDASIRRTGEGVPFGFVVTIDDLTHSPDLFVDPTWGTSWSGAEDLVIVARAFTNGDPPNFDPEFFVSDAWVMHWDLQRLPASHYDARDFWPAGGQENNIAGEPWRRHKDWTLPQHPADEFWLYFAEVGYVPQHGSGAPWFAVYQRQGSGSEGSVMGTERWGMSARGREGFGSVMNECHALGVVPLYKPQGNGFPMHLALAGVDQHGIASLRTRLVRWRLFGVHLETGQSVSDWAVLWGGRVPGLIVPDGSATPYWGWEEQQTATNAVATIMQGGARSSGASIAAVRAVAKSDRGRDYWSPRFAAQLRNQTEGHLLQGVWPDALSAYGSEAQRRLHLWRALQTPGPIDDGTDVCGLLWSFETNPSNQPQPLPLPSEPIVIVPSREAPDVSTLPLPPVADIDAERDHTPEVQVEHFITDIGYRRSWPTYLGLREPMTLRRSGLTLEQAVAMLDFFQDHPVFRLRLPGEDADAALLAQDPRLVDGEGVYTVELRAARLYHQVGG